MLAFLLSLAVVALAAEPLQGFDVALDAQPSYYSLVGTTPRELSKASAVSGVRDQADGTKGAGGTVSELAARFSKEKRDEGCVLIAAKVTVTVRQRLPRWDSAETGTEEARDWWRRFSAAIQEHEDGHKSIDEDSGQALLDAIKSVPPQPTCDALDARVNDEIARAQADQDARNAEYDSRTHHGKTQYARYFAPPKS